MYRFSASIFAFFATIAGAAAATFADLDRAVVDGDFDRAGVIARQLDAEDKNGDFYAVYVTATRDISEGNCAQATLVLEALALVRPGFLPAHQLLYLCDLDLKREEAAAQRLDAMLAILPPGPQHDAVRTMRRQVALSNGPVFDIYGDIVPSSNANRQTVATDLQGLTIPKDNRGTTGINAKVGGTATFGLFTAGNLAASIVGRAQVDYSSVGNAWGPYFALEVPVTATVGDIFAGIAPLVGVKFDSQGVYQFRTGARAFGVAHLSGSSSIAADVLAYVGKHPTQTFLDGTFVEAGLSHTYMLTPELVLTNRLGTNLDLTDDPKRTRASLEWTSRLDYYSSAGLVLSGSGTIGGRWHSSPPPLSIGENQSDTFVSARGEVAHQALTLGPFMPALYYQATRQFSNNVFYQYESHDVGVTLRAKL